MVGVFREFLGQVNGGLVKAIHLPQHAPDRVLHSGGVGTQLRRLLELGQCLVELQPRASFESFASQQPSTVGIGIEIQQSFGCLSRQAGVDLPQFIERIRIVGCPVDHAVNPAGFRDITLARPFLKLFQERACLGITAAFAGVHALLDHVGLGESSVGRDRPIDGGERGLPYAVRRQVFRREQVRRRGIGRDLGQRAVQFVGVLGVAARQQMQPFEVFRIQFRGMLERLDSESMLPQGSPVTGLGPAQTHLLSMASNHEAFGGSLRLLSQAVYS